MVLPILATAKAGRGSLPKLERRPSPVRRTVLVLVVVLLLVVASVLLPASWWPVLGAITAAALVPWILLLLCPIWADLTQRCPVDYRRK